MNQDLTYNTSDISAVSDDISSLNARYQGGIEDINSTIATKLANCSGEIYTEFQVMYQSTIGKALQEGQQIITTLADTLGGDVVDTLNKTEDAVISSFGG